MTNRKLGCFVSVAGGLENAIVNGEKLGVNTIMIHPSPPQRWCTKPFDQKAIEKFNSAKEKSNIENVYMHGIYLTNLANPDKQKFHLGKLALVHYLDLNEQIGADGVVFHVGSFKDSGIDESFERIIKGIDWIFKQSNSSKSILMLEVAAGAGKIVGDKFEELKRIRDGVSDPDRVKYCLDTAHLFASGYDIKDNLEDVICEIDQVLGFENIKLIHFNDSKTELNSKRDRHENIGDGLIGVKAMQSVLNHPKLKDIPFVMETPGLKEFDTAKIEVERLQDWAE